MPENWTTLKFGEFAELRRRGFAPDAASDLPYIGLEHIDPQTLRLDSLGHSSNVISQKSYFAEGDTLYGKLRPYFRKVYRPTFAGVCSTDIWVIKNKPCVDGAFLFYLVASEDFTSVAYSGSSGTRMPRADWSHVKESKWTLPVSIEEQQGIAEILQTLDQQIELNLEMNATLEKIAQAIFKQWFVDFQFPGSNGELVNGLPEGWRIIPISEIVSIRDGTHRSPKPVENGHHLITSKHVNEHHLNFDEAYRISEEDFAEISRRSKVDRFDVLITMIGTVGNLYFVTDDSVNFAIKNIGLYKTSERSDLAHYLYSSLKSDITDKYFKQRLAGSTQQYLTLDSLRNTPVVIADELLMDEYEQTCKAIYEKIRANRDQVVLLRELRNRLLPKLMSGQIRVPS